MTRKRDYIRQVKGNPKLFKFSIGSIGTTRDVIYKEFETHIGAKIWFENYLKQLREMDNKGDDEIEEKKDNNGE